MSVKVSGKNMFAWTVGVHFDLYRAVNDKVLQVGSSVFHTFFKKTASLPFLKGAGRAIVDNHEVEYVKVTTLRAVNGVARLINGKGCFQPELLKTKVQIKRELEINIMRETFSEDSAYPEFSKISAELVGELFRKIIAELLTHLPALAESVTLYKLGLTARYINHKMNQKIDYRNKIISSVIGSYVERVYSVLRVNLTHAVLSNENICPLINFEHIFLKLFTQLHPKLAEKPVGISTNDILIHSLAQSFNLMMASDLEISGQEFASEEEAFIARLDWHKRDGSLPPGVPDPDDNSLTTSNLSQKLDEAMFTYLDALSTEIIDYVVPKKLKSKVLRFLYWLEGRDGLTKIVSYLIGELGIKQVANPHLFALAILNARAIDVADYELDGFGRNKKDVVLGVGGKMLKELLKGELAISEIVSVFNKSSLKQNPGSMEAIKQKRAAKVGLQNYISAMIYNLIKEDDYKHEGLLKGVRQTLQELPILGTATTGMHLLLSGMFFSMNYLTSEKQDVSFFSFVTRHLSGKKLSDFLTERIMALIYHPAWRLVILQSIENLRIHFKKKNDPEYMLEKLDSIADLRTISTFLTHHMTTNFPVKINILTDYLISNDLLRQFRAYLRPSGKPFLEIAMASLVPTAKEFLLYWKISEGFRKKGICFSGDEKFWEVYIRQYLSKLIELRELELGNKKLTLEENVSYRNELVEELLALSEEKQRERIARNLARVKQSMPTVKIHVMPNFIEDYKQEGKSERKETNVTEESFEMIEELCLTERDKIANEYDFSDDFVII